MNTNNLLFALGAAVGIGGLDGGPDRDADEIGAGMGLAVEGNHAGFVLRHGDGDAEGHGVPGLIGQGDDDVVLGAGDGAGPAIGDGRKNFTL